MKVEWWILTVSAPLLITACIHAETYLVADHKQLLIDERFVTEGHGVQFRVNSPCGRELAVSATKPWEGGGIGGYGTVVMDQGKCRMWYIALMEKGPTRLCYAESEDGVHWTKPELGLYAWHGSKANNILMEVTRESAGVMVDPKGPAGERYKLVGRLHQRSTRWPDGTAPAGTGLYMYSSPDGLRWTLHPDRVLPFDPDTLNMALYDDRTGKYLAYIRIWNPQRAVGVDELENLMKPWPYIKGVPPAVPGMIEAPTREVPEAFGVDGDDPDNLDFYTSAVVKYPMADAVFFMFPSAYRHFPEPPVGSHSNSGSLDIDLAVSRDGRRFHRVSRRPYVKLGTTGSGTSRSLYMFIGMVLRDQEIYQYYEGSDYLHGTPMADKAGKHVGGIYLTRQRVDGFVSLDAGPKGGSFVTPPVIFRGRHLVLNMDASATGEVRVELQDVKGKPIGFYDYDSDRGVPLGGFTLAESDPLYFNDVAKVVTWRSGDSDVSHLAGKPVRLSFHLREAKLYSFQFRP